MNVTPNLAGIPSPATPTFGPGPLGTPDAAMADHTAPAEAFSALLARLIPGRVPVPLPVLARAPGELANDGAEADDLAGDIGAGELTAETRDGADRAEADPRPGLAHGVTSGRPGPTAGTRGAGTDGDSILALAAAVAAMAGDTETAARLATEATSGTGGNPDPRLAAEMAATGRNGLLPHVGSATSVGVPDPSRVEKSLELLHPEFRVRLERVVTRMAEEHGHEVDIVETLRHQVRQNHLYEQGRSRPGDVVTWTRASNHATGGAADVIIDGSYDNPVAYARLQRIAAQEGLRTLGARDAGHLELPLPGEASVPTSTESTDSSEPRFVRAETSSPGGRTADRVARPARVAAVADLARLARVDAPTMARVATPGAPPASATGGNAGAGATTPAGRATPPVDDRAPATAPGTPGTPAPDAPRFDGGLLASSDASRSTAPAERMASPALTSGAAERIAHLLDLQSSAPMKPLSQVFLRVDGPGGQDHIRLDLRGGSVSGSIDLNDPAAAERLGARIGDLHRALEQRGLESEALKIRSTPRGEVLDRMAFAAPVDSETVRSAAQRNGDPAFQRERSHGDHSRDEPREGSHDARQRSRKDNPGGKSS